MTSSGSRRTLPIATAIAENYITPLMVMLASLQDHLSSGVDLQLYLLHPGIADAWIGRLEEFVRLSPILIDAAAASRIPYDRRFPREAAYPLLLDAVLPPDLEQVLFLDADLLVLADIADLWEESQGPETIAAVPDLAIPQCGSNRGVKQRKRFGVPDQAAYFNAGVMRINLRRWRQNGVTEKAFAYLAANSGETDFLHQEALNAVLWDDWKPLNPRWNLVASLTGRPYAPTGFRTPPETGLIHFAGHFKPWRIRTASPFDARYLQYLDRLANRLPPLPAPTLRERLLEVYDGRVRDFLYPGERLLWNRGIV